VPIIGVGEATTPLMPQFLHADLGLDVHELFREVRPTLKLGIRFVWGPPDGGGFNYPFGPLRTLEAAVYDGHVRDCSLRSMMMSADRVPVLEEDEGRPVSLLDTEVAYHLDNAPFVRFLAEEARRAGVEHVDARIADVEVDAGGREVRALVADDGRRFAFDLYADCSGFRSLLLEKALGSAFVPFAGSLPTDRAWVATVPNAGAVRPYTLAETYDAGWCWSTPQAHEDHRGYVFCSAFASPGEALAEMRAKNPGMGEPRLVEFRAGRHAHFWRGNVVALGNAYGFVEPLESTALHMLIRQIGLLLEAFPLRRVGGGTAGLLNRKVNGAWDYLRWFLALHYKFNTRLDTPFWHSCRDVDVASHGELLEAFAERGPLSYDRAARLHFDYPDPLWGPEGVDAILLGQGVPSRLPRPLVDRAAWESWKSRCRSVLRRALPQGRALELAAGRPWLLETLAAAYRAAGPAFAVSRVPTF
jgi:tryptophan halogenase